MRKIHLSAIIILFFVAISLPVSTDAKVYIDVDSPSFQLFPIAITDFNTLPPGNNKTQGNGAAFAEELKRYLAMTGFFNPLNKKSFLEEKGNLEIKPENIRFADWAVIGADYLVKGNVRQSEKEIVTECWLFNVTRGEVMLAKKYSAAVTEQKALYSTIASDILLSLTGDEGEFSTKIAFVAKKGIRGDLSMINYDGTDPEAITHHQSIIIAPRWSPDGRFLAFTSFKNGSPQVFIRDLQNNTEKIVSSFEGLNLCGAWSRDSKKLLLTLSKDGNEEIYLLEADTLKLKRLTNNYAIDVSPTWSPDGNRIAFVSNRGGTPQIYIMDADGNNAKRITFEGNYNTSPSWSPRGGRIAYEGLINGSFQIFSVDEEGSNLLQLTFGAVNNESPSWSPSGRQIVYAAKTNSKSKICIMNANGLNVRILYESNENLVMPVWSPRFK